MAIEGEIHPEATCPSQRNDIDSVIDWPEERVWRH
jgi:hypothetical protein